MILVGDVGGTRTRLALAAKGPDGWRLTRLEERATGGADILTVVSRYLADAPATRVKAAAFCGAGPVATDGSIRLTNTNVLLEPAALARAAGQSQAILINDFTAIAASIPHLPAHTLVQRGGGWANAAAPIVVIGPGTGLGVAIATPSAGGWITITGDGGHADLAPVDDEELVIWQQLRAVLPRVSAESVLCGPGLARLHALL
ncbi:MAG: glucokinase, partial [Steroidobacteraceae bacterium]